MGLGSRNIIIGDILASKADVLVFSAHPSLMAGSGVSGVIHKAAGKELEKAAKAFAPVKQGEAIVTPGYNLSAKYVVHAVCPRYIYGNKDEKELLAKAYRSALTVAEGVKKVERIAFVAMGVGIYRWPIELAAQIAIEELTNKTHHKIFVYVIDEAIKKAYLNALA